MLRALGRSIASWPWEPLGLQGGGGVLGKEESSVMTLDGWRHADCGQRNKIQIRDGKLYHNCMNLKEIYTSDGCQVSS